MTSTRPDLIADLVSSEEEEPEEQKETAPQVQAGKNVIPLEIAPPEALGDARDLFNQVDFTFVPLRPLRRAVLKHKDYAGVISEREVGDWRWEIKARHSQKGISAFQATGIGETAAEALFAMCGALKGAGVTE